MSERSESKKPFIAPRIVALVLAVGCIVGQAIAFTHSHHHAVEVGDEHCEICVVANADAVDPRLGADAGSQSARVVDWQRVSLENLGSSPWMRPPNRGPPLAIRRSATFG